MHHHGCKWYVKESQEARKAKGKSENTAPSLFSAVPGARGAAATSFDQHVPEGSPQSPSPTINTEKEKQPNPTAPQPKVPEASRRFWSPEDAIAAATKAACISKLDNLEQKVAAACDNVLKDFEQIVTNAVKAACDGILKDLEETIAATARAECNAMFLGIRQGMDSLSGEMRSLKENSFELTRLLADLVGSPAESQPEIPGVGDA
ncbi:hypothetical protein EMPS_02112 [Entomortierella parvispora]|uniref:Uncharacterized protein n=1 Tax=Entomortierella parvispora TaxID=205924 RepID=A0A9P3H452_9FUNG|nr:hypothetical protein EMPS_02112 [Entomortierella parvispora]